MAGLAADGVPEPHEELAPSPDNVSGFTDSRTIICCWVFQRQAQGRDATVCTLLGGAGHSADSRVLTCAVRAEPQGLHDHLSEGLKGVWFLVFCLKCPVAALLVFGICGNGITRAVVSRAAAAASRDQPQVVVDHTACCAWASAPAAAAAEDTGQSGAVPSISRSCIGRLDVQSTLVPGRQVCKPAVGCISSRA